MGDVGAEYNVRNGGRGVDAFFEVVDILDGPSPDGKTKLTRVASSPD